MIPEAKIGRAGFLLPCAGIAGDQVRSFRLTVAAELDGEM